MTYQMKNQSELHTS